MIVYYWNFELNKICCVSHTCITPDLNKSNKQVTHFINTVFATYWNYCWTEGHGCIHYFSLWSDNYREQFKTNITLAGVQLLLKNTDWMPFSSTTMHGAWKGYVWQWGGITKHACASATVIRVPLLTVWDLYIYLSTHGVDVVLKTANTLHSPEERKYHYFHKGEFLNYLYIDLKINRTICFHSFAIAKQEPFTFYSRNTSCFCESCGIGNFNGCIDFNFHGHWHINILDITPVEQIQTAIDSAKHVSTSSTTYNNID